MDFDADGNLDIVAGIFDGSPHLARGTGKGWRQPEQILDENGSRIVMNAFWNFDTKKWDSTTRCNPEGVELPEGHLTSAWAADMDGDGDLDIVASALLAGGADVDEATLPALVWLEQTRPGQFARHTIEMGTPRHATIDVADIDGDGDLDIVAGNFHIAGSQPSGWVDVWVNGRK